MLSRIHWLRDASPLVGAPCVVLGKRCVCQRIQPACCNIFLELLIPTMAVEVHVPAPEPHQLMQRQRGNLIFDALDTIRVHGPLRSWVDMPRLE